jgi:hypothetical protein
MSDEIPEIDEELPEDEELPGTEQVAAPCPPQVRATGVLAILMAAVMPAAVALAFLRFPEERILSLLVSAGIAAVGALVLMLGGGAFLARARWGRVPLAIFAWTALPAAAGLTVATSDRVANHGAPVGLYYLYGGVGLAAGLFALVLALSLLFGRVAAWGDGTPAPAWEGPSRQSTLALLSLIFAFAPPWGFMHIVSLLLGTLAIGQIRRARGELHGRGLAIAGISVSGGLLVLGFLGSSAAAYFVADRVPADARVARKHLEELALVQRLHGELDWDKDGRDNPCTTTLTALLDAGPADGSGGPLDASAIRALRAADCGVHGDRAVPVAGYVFRLEAEESRWAIEALPKRDARAHPLRVDERGEPWAYGDAYAR